MEDNLNTTDLEEYYRCKQCGSNLLVKIYDGYYVCKSDFVEEFPGWCRTCLIDHCCETDCTTCTIKDKEDCSFIDIKELYLLD